MTNNFLKAVKLLKYSYQVKLNVIMGTLFFVIGIGAILFGIGAGALFDAGSEAEWYGVCLSLSEAGILFIVASSAFFCQLSYGMEFSQMLSAGGTKRQFVVYIPELTVNVISAVGLGFACFVFAGGWARAVASLFGIGNIFVGGRYGDIMATLGFLMFSWMIYVSGIYKLHWQFLGIFVAMMIIHGILQDVIAGGALHFTGRQGILVAFFFYLAGVFAGGVIRRLLYRKPVSTYALGRRMQQFMS